MIKRPLNPKFNTAVLEGWKVTTVRDKPWPTGVPIMLYNWSGAAYRSKQRDVAAVIVTGTTLVRIIHQQDGVMRYSNPMQWVTEGFDSQEDMDSWFRPLVKQGKSVEKSLMLFRLHNEGGSK